MDLDEKVYYVTMQVTGFYTVKVTSENLELTVQKANKEAENEDFGALEDIDWAVHYITDENGNYMDIDNVK